MAVNAAESVRGAFQRARGRTALVHFLHTSAGGFAAYAVGSTADVDTAYTVTVKADQYACTCAAELRPACWHRAAVAAVRACRVGFGMPADGPSAAQVAAAAERAERELEAARREYARDRLAELAELVDAA